MTIINVIYFGIGFVIWIATPISFAAGGLMYMLAGANPALLQTAKSTLRGAAWGIAITLCAYLLVFTFVHVLGGLSQYVGGFGGPTCTVP